jgi:hypothetical protein
LAKNQLSLKNKTIHDVEIHPDNIVVIKMNHAHALPLADATHATAAMTIAVNDAHQAQAAANNAQITKNDVRQTPITSAQLLTNDALVVITVQATAHAEVVSTADAVQTAQAEAVAHRYPLKVTAAHQTKKQRVMKATKLNFWLLEHFASLCCLPWQNKEEQSNASTRSETTGSSLSHRPWPS